MSLSANSPSDEARNMAPMIEQLTETNERLRVLAEKLDAVADLLTAIHNEQKRGIL